MGTRVEFRGAEAGEVGGVGGVGEQVGLLEEGGGEELVDGG